MMLKMILQFSVSHDYDDDDEEDDEDGDDDDVGNEDDDDVGDDDDDDDVIQGLSLTQPVLAKGRKSGRAKQSLYWRPMIANISLPASLPSRFTKARLGNTSLTAT